MGVNSSSFQFWWYKERIQMLLTKVDDKTIPAIIFIQEKYFLR